MNTGNMTKVIDEVIPIRTFPDGSYAIDCAFCEGKRGVSRNGSG